MMTGQSRFDPWQTHITSCCNFWTTFYNGYIIKIVTQQLIGHHSVAKVATMAPTQSKLEQQQWWFPHSTKTHFSFSWYECKKRCFNTGFAGKTRKPSYRWQTRATRKHAKNCSNSMCLQRCRWQYCSIFIRLAVVAPEICEIPRNSLKIQAYRVQGHPRSSILVPIESACTFLLVTNSNFGRISYRFRVTDTFSSKNLFSHPSLVWRLLAAERHEISLKHRWKVHLMGYNSVADIIGLSSFV